MVIKSEISSWEPAATKRDMDNKGRSTPRGKLRGEQSAGRRRLSMPAEDHRRPPPRSYALALRHGGLLGVKEDFGGGGACRRWPALSFGSLCHHPHFFACRLSCSRPSLCSNSPLLYILTDFVLSSKANIKVELLPLSLSTLRAPLLSSS